MSNITGPWFDSWTKRDCPRGMASSAMRGIWATRHDVTMDDWSIRRSVPGQTRHATQVAGSVIPTNRFPRIITLDTSRAHGRIKGDEPMMKISCGLLYTSLGCGAGSDISVKTIPAPRHFRSRPRAPGTHYHLTLDPAVLWTLSNDTSRPTCSVSLNLMPPAPLYVPTLRRYRNHILLLLLYYYRGKFRETMHVKACYVIKPHLGYLYEYIANFKPRCYNIVLLSFLQRTCTLLEYNLQKTIMQFLQGGLRHSDPLPGLCPWIRWRSSAPSLGSAPDNVYLTCF